MPASARLDPADAERIYARCIRPDVLDGASASAAPMAVLVGGQPGAGKSFAVAQLRAHLDAAGGSTAVIAADELRAYHPYWTARAGDDPQAPQRVGRQADAWHARLVGDAVERRLGFVVESCLHEPEAALRLAERLRSAGYRTTVVVLAVERDQSRQATVARYDLARGIGDLPAFVTAAEHEGAYDRLRDSVGRLEGERAVDRLQIITRDGRQLYANQIHTGHWLQQPMALAALDDYRERPLAARELADSALRWQTLVQRLAGDPAVPREVAAQAVAWRNDAAARAEADPAARQMVQWGREAEAFRTLGRTQFLREFPHHARAAERLQEAASYAERTLALADDRERFIAQARTRIADRIAEGRLPEPRREAAAREQRGGRGD